MQYPRFSILPIIWLSDLFQTFPRTLRTIIELYPVTVCRAACLGVKDLKLSWRQGPPTPLWVLHLLLGQHLICNTNHQADVFFVKKVGLGIYQVYIHINVKIGISSGNLSKKILIHRISYRYTYAIQGLIGRGRSEIKTQN